MMMSSKMDCGTVHASSHIAKQHHALSDTTIQKSPAVLKKKCSGASKKKKKGGGGPKPPVGVIPPPAPSPPSPPSTEVDITINQGWLLFLLCFSSFFTLLFDCCVCGCYSQNSTFLTSRWLSRLVFVCFLVALLFVHCCSPFSVFYYRTQPNNWLTYWWIVEFITTLHSSLFHFFLTTVLPMQQQ